MTNLKKDNRELLQLLGAIQADLLMRAKMKNPDDVVVELGNGLWYRLNETLKTVPELEGYADNFGKIPTHHKQWFTQLQKAMANGHVALMACLDAKTMEQRSVIALVGHKNGEFTMTPLGHLCPDENPFEAYLPPRTEQEIVR